MLNVSLFWFLQRHLCLSWCPIFRVSIQLLIWMQHNIFNSNYLLLNVIAFVVFALEIWICEHLRCLCFKVFNNEGISSRNDDHDAICTDTKISFSKKNVTLYRQHFNPVLWIPPQTEFMELLHFYLDLCILASISTSRPPQHSLNDPMKSTQKQTLKCFWRLDSHICLLFMTGRLFRLWTWASLSIFALGYTCTQACCQLNKSDPPRNVDSNLFVYKCWRGNQRIGSTWHFSCLLH